MGAAARRMAEAPTERFLDSGSMLGGQQPPKLFPDQRRLFIVSNRLPFTAVEENGECWLRPNVGGLATALTSIHARSNSLWLGSVGAGDSSALIGRAMDERLASARLVGIPLSDREVTGFYRQYSNEFLWPMLHGLQSPSPHVRRGWADFQSVNERFADVIAGYWRTGDSIWIHDYHLMLLPSMLRDRLPGARIGFFLHTPFPSAASRDSLSDLPYLAKGILGADVIGFQTRHDVRHFANAVGGTLQGTGEAGCVRNSDGRIVRAITCPIGIDYAWFAERSRRAPVVKQTSVLRARSPGPLFVGVDRLDYTKGISQRLLAFERLLDFEPGLRHRARFVQVAVPTREGVHGYQETRQRIEEIVARINGTHGTAAWAPVDYIHDGVDANTLVALYRAADVMVVTPKRDGMNLVAKEFVASRTDGRGALVLSRAAGAAEELRAAILVDADDVASIMNGYRRALGMSDSETRTRMRKLRGIVQRRTVCTWASRFLDALGAVDR